MGFTVTPLRYPGGKSALTDFLARVAAASELRDAYYAEPYCGGAGAAIALLFREAVTDVFLNDVDRSVFSLWQSILIHTDDLCRLVETASLTVDYWREQQYVWRNPDKHSLLEVGFACLFLNRVNRSGVLAAGLIGGIGQTGKWRMDARFNRSDLVAKIRRIARYRNRIHVSNFDAECFLKKLVAGLSRPTLVYLDPPYFVKGQSLYENHYGPDDHRRLAELLTSGELTHWLVSYDAAPEVRELYRGLRRLTYRLNYSAARRYAGRETIFFSPALALPAQIDPFINSNDRVWTGRFFS